MQLFPPVNSLQVRSTHTKQTTIEREEAIKLLLLMTALGIYSVGVNPSCRCLSAAITWHNYGLIHLCCVKKKENFSCISQPTSQSPPKLMHWQLLCTQSKHTDGHTGQIIGTRWLQQCVTICATYRDHRHIRRITYGAFRTSVIGSYQCRSLHC